MGLQVDGAEVETVEGEILDFLPRWGIESSGVRIGPYHNPAEHEIHWLGLVGSTSWLGERNEELLFSKTDGMLKSVLVRFPEVNIPLNAGIDRWLGAEHRSGLLKLKVLRRFGLELRSSRFFAPDGSSLVCVWETAALESTAIFRLRIAVDFDLVFVDDNLCGWILSHPTKYFVECWEQPFATTPTREFIELLREYLEIVAEPQIDLLQDSDPGLKSSLVGLLDRVMSESNADKDRRRVLSSKIQNVLEIFY